MPSGLFFTFFGSIWLFVWFTIIVSLVGTIFSVWMTIDAIRRFQADSGKMILYLLMIWFLPFGWLIYYFAAVPKDKRFFRSTLSKYRGLVIGGTVALIIIFLLGSAVLAVFVKSAHDAQKRVQAEIEQGKEEQRQRKEEFDQKYDEIGEDIEQGREEVQSAPARQKIFAACGEEFYFGLGCDGEVPQSVVDAAAKEGITDEEEIREICGCSSASF